MTDKEINELEFPSLKAKTAQENGARSRGPKSAQGKANSSRNALKHGLRSKKTVVLDPNDQEDYNRYRQSMLESLNPNDSAQATFAELAVVNAWRLKKSIEFQTDVLIDYQDEDQPEYETYFRYVGEGKFRTFQDYEKKFEASLHRALKALLALKTAEETIKSKSGTNEPKPAIPFFSGLPELEPEKEPEEAVQNEGPVRCSPRGEGGTQVGQDMDQHSPTKQTESAPVAPSTSDKRTQESSVCELHGNVTEQKSDKRPVRRSPQDSGGTPEPRLDQAGQHKPKQNPVQTNEQAEEASQHPNGPQSANQPTPKPKSSRSQYGFGKTEEEYREDRKRLGY